MTKREHWHVGSERLSYGQGVYAVAFAERLGFDAVADIENRPRGYRGRFEFLTRWTRTQRIRTAAGIHVEAVIIDHAELLVYLRIADRAKHLRDLGMSDRAVARALGVSDKTVAKAAGRPELSPPDCPNSRNSRD